MRTPDWQEERRTAHARAARPGTCPRCGRPVLRGLDADVAAFSVTVDAQPVNNETDILTYDLIGRGRGANLWRRTAKHRASPARYPIHQEHRCEKQLPL